MAGGALIYLLVLRRKPAVRRAATL